MKLLILSDTHLFNDILKNVNDHYLDITDYHIHCGDSSLNKDDVLLKDYNIVVEGNHDNNQFPIYSIYNNILVTHGHKYNIYRYYDDLVNLCHENNCKYCLFGHTHIPTVDVIDDITFINPGSLMINRGTYGYGTFVVCDYIDQHIYNIQFINSETLEKADDFILDEGKELFKEFRGYEKKMRNS